MFNDRLKQAWGFHPMQEAYYYSLKEENTALIPARVVFSSHEHYRVLILGSEKEQQARVRGSFYHSGEDLPVVGDWVVAELLEGDHEYLPIEAVLPRMASLKRADEDRGEQVLVANVDIVGLVTSFNQDLNENRLERGLAMITESGARPLIIINKSDLIPAADAEALMKTLSTRFGEVTILPCSAQTGQGITEIISHFKEGASVAFLGMSGVGKSTLINAILGESHLETSGIRERDSRGRHTTTHREVVLTKHGFWLIDNPGIREFSFSGNESGLDHTFDDIAELMGLCRFGNCSHGGEPGCRIAEALASGELLTDRWENYQKMKRELEYHENKNNKRYQSERRKEWAKINKGLRQRLKEKGRR